MAYKVVDIYKDLPKRAGCRDCGKPGCFAFATAVYIEGLPLDLCPHVDELDRGRMAEKLSVGKDRGDGVRPEATEQAAAFLFGKLREAERLAPLAEKGAAELVGPPEAIRLELLGRPYEVTRDAVVALGGPEPNVWVKVLLLLYLTHATGEEPAGELVAYRELPNTVAKTKTFDKEVGRIASAFGTRLEALRLAAEALGGEVVADESADLSIAFRALPRVPLRLLLWDGDDDFPARASLLVDRGVLGYLDQESLVFLAQTLVSRLLGEDDPAG